MPDTIADLVVKVSADMTDVVSEVNRMAGGIAQLDPAVADLAGRLGELGGAMSVAFSGAAVGQIDQFGAALQGLPAAAQDMAEGFTALTGAQEDYGGTAQETVNVQRELDDQMEKSQEIALQMEAAYLAGQASAAELAESHQQLADATAKAGQAMKESGEEGAKGTQDLVRSLTELGEAVAITEGLKEFFTEAVRAYDGLQRVTIALTAMRSAMDDVGEELERLEGMGTSDALSMPALLAADQRMASLGISSERSLAALQAAADTAAATGGSFEGLTGMMDRMAQTGYASSRFLAHLGITLKELGAAMGTTESQAAATFRALDVGQRIDALSSAMGKYAGMSQAVAQTIGGQFQVLKNQIEGIFVGIGQLIAPVVGSLVSAVGSLLDVVRSVVDGFNRLDKPARDILATFGLMAAAIIPAVAAFKLVVTSLEGLTRIPTIVAETWASLMTLAGVEGAVAAETAADTAAVAANTGALELNTQAALENAAATAARGGAHGETAAAAAGEAVGEGAAAAGAGITEAAGAAAGATGALGGLSAGLATLGSAFATAGIYVGPFVASVITLISFIDELNQKNAEAVAALKTNNILAALADVPAGEHAMEWLKSAGYSINEIKRALTSGRASGTDLIGAELPTRIQATDEALQQLNLTRDEATRKGYIFDPESGELIRRYAEHYRDLAEARAYNNNKTEEELRNEGILKTAKGEYIRSLEAERQANEKLLKSEQDRHLHIQEDPTAAATGAMDEFTATNQKAMDELEHFQAVLAGLQHQQESYKGSAEGLAEIDAQVAIAKENVSKAMQKAYPEWALLTAEAQRQLVPLEAIAKAELDNIKIREQDLEVTRARGMTEAAYHAQRVALLHAEEGIQLGTAQARISAIQGSGQEEQKARAEAQAAYDKTASEFRVKENEENDRHLRAQIEDTRSAEDQQLQIRTQSQMAQLAMEKSAIESRSHLGLDTAAQTIAALKANNEEVFKARQDGIHAEVALEVSRGEFTDKARLAAQAKMLQASAEFAQRDLAISQDQAQREQSILADQLKAREETLKAADDAAKRSDETQRQLAGIAFSAHLTTLRQRQAADEEAAARDDARQLASVNLQIADFNRLHAVREGHEAQYADLIAHREQLESGAAAAQRQQIAAANMVAEAYQSLGQNASTAMATAYFQAVENAAALKAAGASTQDLSLAYAKILNTLVALGDSGKTAWEAINKALIDARVQQDLYANRQVKMAADNALFEVVEKERLEGFGLLYKSLQQDVHNMWDEWAKGFATAITQGKNFGQTLMNVLHQVENQILSTIIGNLFKQAMSQLSNVMTAGGTRGGILGAIGAFIGGKEGSKEETQEKVLGELIALNDKFARPFKDIGAPIPPTPKEFPLPPEVKLPEPEKIELPPWLKAPPTPPAPPTVPTTPAPPDATAGAVAPLTTAVTNLTQSAGPVQSVLANLNAGIQVLIGLVEKLIETIQQAMAALGKPLPVAPGAMTPPTITMGPAAAAPPARLPTTPADYLKLFPEPIIHPAPVNVEAPPPARHEVKVEAPPHEVHVRVPPPPPTVEEPKEEKPPQITIEGWKPPARVAPPDIRPPLTPPVGAIGSANRVMDDAMQQTSQKLTELGDDLGPVTDDMRAVGMAQQALRADLENLNSAQEQTTQQVQNLGTTSTGAATAVQGLGTAATDAAPRMADGAARAGETGGDRSALAQIAQMGSGIGLMASSMARGGGTMGILAGIGSMLPALGKGVIGLFGGGQQRSGGADPSTVATQQNTRALGEMKVAQGAALGATLANTVATIANATGNKTLATVMEGLSLALTVLTVVEEIRAVTGWFQHGGVVPGGRNAPMRAVVHGGELVANESMMRELGTGMATGTTEGVMRNIAGLTAGSTANASAAAARAIGEQLSGRGAAAGGGGTVSFDGAVFHGVPDQRYVNNIMDTAVRSLRNSSRTWAFNPTGQ